MVLAVGDDFDQQGVVVGRDDGPLEGGSVVQADAHALPAAEHLQGEAGRLRTWVGSLSKFGPQPRLDRWGPSTRVPAGQPRPWPVTFFISASAQRGREQKRTAGQRGRLGGTEGGSGCPGEGRTRVTGQG